MLGRYRVIYRGVSSVARLSENRRSLFHANALPTRAESTSHRPAVERYQSIDDTIVQLFISQASVLMSRVDRFNRKSSESRIRRRNMKTLKAPTSHDVLGNTGTRTGFWLEGFAAPYFVFRDAGVQLTLASPKGGQPPLDPKSDLPENQTRAQIRFKKDLAAVKLADEK